MPEPVACKYRAFISYSHVDTSWAKWLHGNLEGFRIDKDLVGRETDRGTIPKTLRPIFRDRDDFVAGDTLSEQTLDALDASHGLIVISSPSAAKSNYVNEEIRLFKSRHPERPVIPLIVDGKPGDAELECFPRSLRSRLDEVGQITDEPVEVLAADAREEGDGKLLTLAKVVAGLLGVSSDDIYRRAERARRRRNRIRSLISVVVVGVGSVGGYYAWTSHHQGSAIEQQDKLVNKVADMLVMQGKLDEALEVYQDRLAILGRLYAADPEERNGSLTEIGLLNQKIGDVLRAQGKPDEAGWFYTRSVTSLRAGSRSDLFLANKKAGDFFKEEGKLREAIFHYQAGLDVAGGVVRSHLSSTEWERNLALSHEWVADVLAQEGNQLEALNEYREARAIIARLAWLLPDDDQLANDLSVLDGEIAELDRTEASETTASQPEQATR